MIRLSKETDYGIVLLSHFASEGVGATYSSRALAAETQIPLPMVSKILKVLARQGWLVSQRGAKGGYTLALRPDTISVAEIIKGIEGPIAITECVEAPGDCRQESVCRTRHHWKMINRTVRKALETITLLDMATPIPDRLVALDPVPAGFDYRSPAEEDRGASRFLMDKG